MYAPVDAFAWHTFVAVADVARAAADILASPALHKGRTYRIFSARFTHAQLADALSDALGEDVAYVRVSYARAREAMVGLGFPAWQADGILELFQLIDKGSPITNLADSENDYWKITGTAPTQLGPFIRSIAEAFR